MIRINKLAVYPKAILKFIEGLVLDFGLSLVLLLIGRVIFYILAHLMTVGENDNPIVFSYIWILLLLFIPVIIIIKCRLGRLKIHRIIFCIIIMRLFSISVEKGVSAGYIKTDNIEIVNRNYVAIAGKVDPGNYIMYGSRKKVINHSHSLVFAANDARINKELNNLNNEFGETNRKKIIFWQTALAEDYSPKYIKGYNCCSRISDRFKLYITVGPLVILEKFIESFNDALLFLIIPFLFRLTNKPILFKDFKGFLRYFNRAIKEESAIKPG